jgi:hypothetical protein
MAKRESEGRESRSGAVREETESRDRSFFMELNNEMN